MNTQTNQNRRQVKKIVLDVIKQYNGGLNNHDHDMADAITDRITRHLPAGVRINPLKQLTTQQILDHVYHNGYIDRVENDPTINDWQYADADIGSSKPDDWYIPEEWQTKAMITLICYGIAVISILVAAAILFKKLGA
jgi:hypothetical protein